MHRSIVRVALPALALASGLALTQTAEAKPNVTRRGGQWGVMLGGSACIPGQSKCRRDDIQDGGITIDGKTKPSFGLGAELGYRLKPWMYIGAQYNLGFFNTEYEITGANGYKRAYQHSIYGVVRPILPVWRFDFGLGVGPGFSRQAFTVSGGGKKDKDYSQGFSFLISPSIDIWVARRIFIGAKVDLLLNGHGKLCRDRDNTTTCQKRPADRDIAMVHQTIFGLHIGGTFL